MNLTTHNENSVSMKTDHIIQNIRVPFHILQQITCDIRQTYQFTIHKPYLCDIDNWLQNVTNIPDNDDPWIKLDWTSIWHICVGSMTNWCWSKSLYSQQ